MPEQRERRHSQLCCGASASVSSPTALASAENTPTKTVTSSALLKATLRFQGADPEGRKFGFNLKFSKLLEKREGLVIGRDFECDGVLSHSTVSRRHARLVLADDILQIEDLSSTNGTAVDDAVVAAGTLQPLHVGAKLRIGDIELAFRFDYHGPKRTAKQAT